MYVKTYDYKGYEFVIEYNSRDGLYTAKCGTMSTYDTNIEDLKEKIKTVVYQNKGFKLSVDDYPFKKNKGEL